jgi:hypothetical protein
MFQAMYESVFKRKSLVSITNVHVPKLDTLIHRFRICFLPKIASILPFLNLESYSQSFKSDFFIYFLKNYQSMFCGISSLTFGSLN